MNILLLARRYSAGSFNFGFFGYLVIIFAKIYRKMIKNILICFLLCTGIHSVTGQERNPAEDILITSMRKQLSFHEDADGILYVNVPPRKVRKFKKAGFLQYSEFGAKGDGETDDIDAIAATHAFANLLGLPVRADQEAAYYIGRKDRTAVIQTSTDFGSAEFIIDDRAVENHRASVFLVRSTLQPFTPEGITSLKKGQQKVRMTFNTAQLQDVPLKRSFSVSRDNQKSATPSGSVSINEDQGQTGISSPAAFLVTVTDDNVRRYIRYGPNQNDGAPQTDIFAVDQAGNVDMNAPIIWDFDQITDITALPLDRDTLFITGGRFTTIANQAPSKYTYYNRNIAIRRSNVVVDGLEHHVTGEGAHGAPYGGFLNISDCAYVTVKNTLLTGHKTYETIGSAGRPVSMGSYDLSVYRALNVSFINCSQTNDIDDRTYWGILGSNYCKNLLYDKCTLSRFDAHMGVANATIRNSTLGHMGINAIGTGTFIVENSTVRGRSLINLRQDYGSTWQGEFIIRNCVFVPYGGRPAKARLFNGYNSGQHDFGYTCYMPDRITIENLYIDDSSHPDDYQGPVIFSDFNREMTDDSYQQAFPYVITKEVILKNVTTASGQTLRISDNPYMFRNVKVVKK